MAKKGQKFAIRTDEEKLSYVRSYLNNKKNGIKRYKESGISPAVFYSWVRKYKSGGLDCLRSHYGKSYTIIFFGVLGDGSTLQHSVKSSTNGSTIETDDGAVSWFFKVVNETRLTSILKQAILLCGDRIVRMYELNEVDRWRCIRKIGG